ncbi:MAG: MFS transporter [Candidatus Methanodesulfokora sp.]
MLKVHYRVLLISCLVYAFAAMNTMLIGALLVPIAREWGLSKPDQGILASSGYVGMFLGAIIFGILADRIGRRATIGITVALLSLFTGMCGMASNMNQMILLRFIAGMGLGGALPQPGVYTSEYAPDRYRGRFLGLVETSWVYGVLLAMLISWTVVPSAGWRFAFALGYTPLLLIPLLFLMPESIRYLISSGKIDLARDMANKFGINLPEVKIEKRSYKKCMADILGGKFRKRTLLLWILWFSLVYTYHGIFIWLPSIYYNMGIAYVRSIEFTLLVTLVQIPGYYSSTFLLDSVGRKKTLSVYLALAGIGSLMFATARDITSILLYSCVISFFNLGSWAGLYAYTPELYPTEIRGFGSGTAAAMGRVAGILAPYLTGIVWTMYGLNAAFLVFFVIHLLASISTLILGIETKRKTLEELSS